MFRHRGRIFWDGGGQIWPVGYGVAIVVFVLGCVDVRQRSWVVQERGVYRALHALLLRLHINMSDALPIACSAEEICTVEMQMER